MLEGGRGGSRRVRIVRFEGDHPTAREDRVAVEEPLEIRVRAWEDGAPVSRPLAVTMRTPGDDLALAVGFAFSEGVVAGRQEIESVTHCPGEGESRGNIVEVRLRPGVALAGRTRDRLFPVTSACGVCGRASLEELALRCTRLADRPGMVTPALLRALPGALRGGQRVFRRTGGLHAAGLFLPDGTPEGLKEDVGRHNAVDRVVGAALMEGRLPLEGRILVVSGRTSWEIVAKALGAGIHMVAGVGAPSSLAVRVARTFNLTLVGFLRAEGFNVYAGGGRIEGAPGAAPGDVEGAR
jgi:FdhD protein